MNDSVVSPPRPSADQTRTRGTATVIPLHPPSTGDTRRPTDDPQRKLLDRVKTLEGYFNQRLTNLVDLSLVGKPGESTRASCAGLSLAFGLWHRKNGDKLVFDRAVVLTISDPYSAPGHRINAAKFRDAIQQAMPTITVEDAGHVLIEIEGVWKLIRKSAPKLSAFAAERKRLLDTTGSRFARINTVDLFDFLFKLAQPSETSA